MSVEAAPVTEAGAAASLASLWRRIDRGDLARTLFVAVCALAVAVDLTWPWPQVPLIAVVGLVVGC